MQVSSGLGVTRRNRGARVALWLVPAVVVTAGVLAFALRPAPPAPPPAPRPVAPIGRARVVIDTSASMAGYFTGKTEFKDFLVQFIAELRPKLSAGNPKTPEIVYAFVSPSGSQLVPYPGDSQQLIDDVLNNRVIAGAGSMLQDVVSEIKDTAASDEVTLLLTDGIFSHRNEAVKQNPEINRMHIEVLAAHIQGSLQDPVWEKKKIKPGLAVLQYLSNFAGTYFSYKNDRLACCPGPRPFYLWILGDAPRVGRVFTAIRDTAGRRPAHALMLGHGGRAATPRVLSYTNRTGNWLSLRAPGRLGASQVPTDGAAQLTVALNLGEVPDDQLLAKHVSDHLTIRQNFATVRFKEFVPRAQMQARFSPRDEIDLSGATHFLVLEIGNLSVDHTSVSVALKEALPKWCQESTVENDLETASPGAPPRTFGLLPIMNGASRALSSEPVFAFELTLEK